MWSLHIILVVFSFTVVLVKLIIFFHAQLLALELERRQKWVKMIKNWEKYIRGEKVKQF